MARSAGGGHQRGPAGPGSGRIRAGRAYLEEQLKQTSVAEIRELLAGLLRSHMESRMMAAVEPNYVFSVIDPPTVPELKSEPKRPLILRDWNAPRRHARDGVLHRASGAA